MKASLELSTKPNRNGLFEIYVRIQDKDGKKKRTKAGVAVDKRQFRSKNHNMKWVINHPNHHKINADLRAIIDQYEDILFAGSVQHKVLTPETLLDEFGRGTFSSSLTTYWEQKMALMLNYNQRKGYKSVLENWKEFTKAQKLGDLEFKQITVHILKRFENFLYGKQLKSSTVYSNLKRIRAFFNSAIKEGILQPGDYIFKAYTMPRPNKAKKERLNLEELKNFAEGDYPHGSLMKTSQQVFLLAFNLAGVRIEDLLTLKWTDVASDRIEYEMVKTGAWNSFKLTPQLVVILNYFKSIKVDSKYIVPLVDDSIDIKKENEKFKKEINSKTALVNKYLKKIATERTITKNITTHISRHTFADLASKRTNGNVKFVQNALKHSSLSITEAYLTDLDSDSLDEKMGEVTSL